MVQLVITLKHSNKAEIDKLLATKESFYTIPKYLISEIQQQFDDADDLDDSLE